MAINSAQIISGVQLRYTMPAFQGLLTDENILSWANEVVQDEIIPIFLSVDQDYFIQEYLTDIITDVSKYAIPYRAVGRALRELKITMPNTSTNTYYNVPLIRLSDAYNAYGSLYTQISGFYFDGDYIKLVPNGAGITYSTPSIMCIWYFLPPSQLVSASAVGLVTAINRGSNYVTVSSVPAGFTTGTVIDFVQAISGNNIYSMDIPIASVSGSNITFAADTIPDELVVGDYICPAGQSYVLNFIPNEAYPLIVSLISKRALQAIGDYDAVKVIEKDIMRQIENLLKIIEPRITGEPTIAITRNNLCRSRYSFYRSAFYGP